MFLLVPPEIEIENRFYTIHFSASFMRFKDVPMTENDALAEGWTQTDDIPCDGKQPIFITIIIVIMIITLQV